TVTRMIEQTHAAIGRVAAGPIALVGSSLGAFVAVHAWASVPPAAPIVDRLVLLAPALDFGGNRLRQLGDTGIDDWRRSGALRVFHYADNRPRDVRFALYEDAARYDAFAVRLTLPARVYQGRHDESVEPAMVTRWAAAQPLVDLRMLDDDHQLHASMDRIW